LLSLPVGCQAAAPPGWSWGLAGNAQTLADVNAVACPGDGSSFAAGTFGRNIVLGNLQLTAPDLYGTWQGFATKFDLTGQGLWAVEMTATNGILPLGVASDGAGGCFVAGGFAGNAVLGGWKLSGGTNFEVFVTRVSAGGAFLWAKSFSGTEDCYALTCLPGPAGGLYVGGAFDGQLLVGTNSLTAQPSGAQNGFLASLDNTGKVRWAHRTGGALLGSAVSPSGIVYAAGSFSGPSGVFENQTVTISAAEARYVARFTADGSPGWVQYFTSDATPSGNTTAAVAATADESVCLAGTFTTSTSVGGQTFTSAGAEDVALVRYSPSGVILKAGSFGGTGSDVSQGVAIYGSNNVVIVGSFEQELSLGTNTLAATGSQGISAFVACFDTNAVPVWLTGPTNVTELAAAQGVAVDGAGVMVGGQLEGYGGFGPFLLGAVTPGLSGVMNCFVARLTDLTVAHRFPSPPDNSQGNLAVYLTPPESNGQWRFPWDLAWRNSGDTVSNLLVGNYTINFRNVPGWLAFPPTATAVVTKGGLTQVTNQYYPTFDVTGTTNTGALKVNIGPSAPNGAGWRFLGETAWHGPGFTATNLVPDAYAVEYEPVSGYARPANQAVQVYAGSTTVIWGSYSLAQSPPAGVDLPVPVATNSISDLIDYPYGFNGQLQSDVGFGSGVAVQTNVVMTAAHLVFSDQTLSYVSQIYWYFQEEAGVFVPEPQAARGWYVLSGYASQRTNDILGGLAPGQSSPQSRNLDVAALYFPSPVAGGGYGGYLPSDTVPNSWLNSTSQKMLVGYPVDGSSLGDSSIAPGVMYQVGPQSNPLNLATDPVADQQVYTATWFLSYPGNSGGPLYVQFNGYYYPAGVYLGTLYNGIVPYASLVRGIDSNVVNLITRAQALGDSGTNGTGGGVITIVAGSGSPQLAYLQVDIGPQAALDAGGAWRVQGTTAWASDPQYTATLASGSSVTLEFKAIPAWNLPPNNTVQITPGQMTVVAANYTSNPAQMGVTPASGLSAGGFAGGPFNPSENTYTLTNSGGASLNWSASKPGVWLSLSVSNGTLAAGASTNVTISLNANANSLAAGAYTNTVGFTNLSNGLGNTARSVSLAISVHPPVQFTNVHVLSNKSLALTLLGVTNRVYSILGATNLLQPATNWTEVLRLTNLAGQTAFTLTNSTPSKPQFYRAREL